MVTNDASVAEAAVSAETVRWLDAVLPRVIRRLSDSSSLELPLMQLPVAQLRLVRALAEEATGKADRPGETMGRLSERLRVRHNALTQAADRLVAQGLVRRSGDPRDRRIVRLALTDRGQEWVAAHRDARRAHLSRLLEALTLPERSTLLEAVRMLDSATSRLAGCGGPDPGRTTGNDNH